MLSDEDETNATESPCNKRMKSTIDLERVIMGEKLTDIEINFAQKTP